MVRRREAPSADDAPHRRENLAGPTVATSFETRYALLRMRVWRWCHRQGATRRARSHPPRCSSPSLASASNLSRTTNCDSAQTAAPRTSGLASSSKRSASRRSDASPALPIAISTLRTKRSRPMRLTGDFENSARNAASSSRASSASAGARKSVARGELWPRGLLRKLVPRADREAIVAAIDAVADRSCGIRAGSAPCARSSGRKCSAAHRAGKARGTLRSDRRRGRRVHEPQ